jgi:hypothetical protein
MAAVTWPATRLQLEAAGYSMDRKSAQCRSCHREIVWSRTPAQKAMPLSIVGVKGFEQLYQSHFADCPDAVAHRKVRPISDGKP